FLYAVLIHPRESRHLARRIAGGWEHLGERSDHGSAVQEHADAELRVIADNRAKFGSARGNLLAVSQDADRSVIAAQVGGLDTGSEVHPFTDITVADEAIVILVGVAKHEAALDLAADAAMRADAGAGAYPRSEDDRSRSNAARAFEPGEGMDTRAG